MSVLYSQALHLICSGTLVKTLRVALVRALLCGDPVHTRPSLLAASRRQALLLLRVWGVTGLQPMLGAGAALHCSAWLWGAVLAWFQTREPGLPSYSDPLVQS